MGICQTGGGFKHSRQKNTPALYVQICSKIKSFKMLFKMNLFQRSSTILIVIVETLVSRADALVMNPEMQGEMQHLGDLCNEEVERNHAISDIYPETYYTYEN